MIPTPFPSSPVVSIVRARVCSVPVAVKIVSAKGFKRPFSSLYLVQIALILRKQNCVHFVTVAQGCFDQTLDSQAKAIETFAEARITPPARWRRDLLVQKFAPMVLQ